MSRTVGWEVRFMRYVMSAKVAGVGSARLTAYRDRDGDWQDGTKPY